ncbi:unnamed protein product, partial [Rhizoctonia solani]
EPIPLHRDPTISGILTEGTTGLSFGDQGALLKSIQQLILNLTIQVMDLSQQLKDRDQQFKELQSLVKEVNQTVNQGVHTPETKPTGVNEDIIMFLLINMEGAAAARALPHITLVGKRNAIIRTPEDFAWEFKKTFDNPDATTAAEQKITELAQTTTAAYMANFWTLQLEIDWNENALQAQYQQGLNWQVRTQLAMMTPQPWTLEDLMEAAICIDNVRHKLEASRPPWDSKPSTQKTTAQLKGTSSGTQVKEGNPTYVSTKEQEKRHAANQCIKCGRKGHRAAVCCTGWLGPGMVKDWEDKKKAKETTKVAKAGESESEKE